MPVIVASPKQKLPGGHGVAIARPVTEQNVPAPQLTHELELPLDWKVATAQLEHTLDDIVE